MGFDKYTKVALAEREGQGERERDREYMATSPHAAYDSNRNKRLLANAEQRQQDEFKKGLEESDEFQTTEH